MNNYIMFFCAVVIHLYLNSNDGLATLQLELGMDAS